MNLNKCSTLLESQYKLAIAARDKLKEDFHRWMTYYYVANAAILVAITSLYKNAEASYQQTKIVNDVAKATTVTHVTKVVQQDPAILLLSVLGIFVCILWNLSCKGYSFWSNSWIEIIIGLERRVTKGDWRLGVYSVFSKDVHDKHNNVIKPNEPANISTPKLTMLFSYCSMICWIAYSSWTFFHLSSWPGTIKIVIELVALAFISVVYIKCLPHFAKSKVGDLHKLI